MTECYFSKGCPFYKGGKTSQAQAVSAWLRYQYCRGNFAMCARYVVHEALGQCNVPADLMPYEQVSAQQILSRANLQRGFVRKAA